MGTPFSGVEPVPSSKVSEVDHPDYYMPVPSPAAGPYWAPPSPEPFQAQPFKPDTGRAGPNGWRRVTSGIAAVGAFIAKFGAVIVKLKYAGVLISMFVSVAAYALLWGWTFAAGFVALLFVHEMGHWLEIRRQGIPASKPTFIPFLGALISMRGLPANAYQEARVALAGPAAGTAASILVAIWSAHTGSAFLQALAYIGFFLNLFNLLPALPLDGGRAVGALHPAIWLAGLVALVLVEAWRPSPVIPLILILGAFELLRRWRGRNTRAARTYYALTGSQRTVVAAAYLALVGVTIYGAHATYVLRHLK
jgi:Zn-dependent protease